MATDIDDTSDPGRHTTSRAGRGAWTHQLRTVTGTVCGEVLTDLTDGRAEDDLVELHRAIERLETELLRRVADLDRRGSFRRDGHLSTASWLVSALRIGWGAAREQVRLARSLASMRRTRRALEAGDISMSGARLLAITRETDPSAFERAEPYLVEAARSGSLRDLHRVTAVWRDAAERDAIPDADERRAARRRLHASVTLGGMVRIDGDLDPVNGEAVLTAIRAVVDAEVRGGEADARSPAQARADALGEVCRQWLDAGAAGAVTAERPHITVTVPVELLPSPNPDPDTAARTTGGARLRGANDVAETNRVLPPAELAAELDGVGPVGREIARSLACDASVMRVVMRGRSEPLDVGRRSAVVPPAIRRAVIARDRHCRFPGCDRPYRWCDAHHLEHWADGGETALCNLVLLCRRHHRLVHVGGFRIEMSSGGPVFRRRDGSVLAERAPP